MIDINQMTKFIESVRALAKFFTVKGLYFSPESVAKIEGIDEQISFIDLFDELQRERIKFIQLNAFNDEPIDADGFYSEQFHLQFVVAYLDLVDLLKFKELSGSDNETLKNHYFDLSLYSFPSISVGDALVMFSKGLPINDVIDCFGSSSDYMVERRSLIPFLKSLSNSKYYSLTALNELYEGFLQIPCQYTRALGLKHGVNMMALHKIICESVKSKQIDMNAISGICESKADCWKERAILEKRLLSDVIPLMHFKNGKTIAGLGSYL